MGNSNTLLKNLIKMKNQAYIKKIKEYIKNYLFKKEDKKNFVNSLINLHKKFKNL